MCGIPLTKGAVYLYYAPKPVEFSSSSAAFVLITMKEAFSFKFKIFYFEGFSKKPRLLGPKRFYRSNVTTHKIYYHVSDYFSYRIAQPNPLSQCSILPLILALVFGMYRIQPVTRPQERVGLIFISHPKRSDFPNPTMARIGFPWSRVTGAKNNPVRE